MTQERTIIFEEYVIQYSRKGADDWYATSKVSEVWDRAKVTLKQEREHPANQDYEFRIVKRTTYEEVIEA